MEMPSTVEELAPRKDGWILAGLAMILYLTLGQTTSYFIDGEVMLFNHVRDAPNTTYHYFCPALLDAAVFALKPLGLSLHRIACVLSAVGTAVGVLLVHAAGRCLRLDRRDALLATAFVAVCPGWMFFATIVEVHGPFLPFAGLSLLAISNLLRRGGDARASLAGLAIGLTYLAHPTGVLLIATFPVLFYVARGRGVIGDLRFARHGALVTLAVLVCMAIGSATFLEGRGAKPSLSLHILMGNPYTLINPRGWAQTVWTELLIPFSPLAILGLALAFLRTRRTAAWLLVSTIPFLMVSVLLFEYGGGDGAYVLPIAWPAALCILPLVNRRRWVAVALLACSAAIGATRIWLHDNPEPTRAYAEGFRSIGGPRALLVVGQCPDMSAYFKYLDDLPFCFLGDIIQVEGEAGADAVVGQIRNLIEGYLDAGHRIFLSEGCIHSLEEATKSGNWPLAPESSGIPGAELRGRPTGPRRLQAMMSTYELEPVARLGFVGTELRRRQ